MEEKMKATEEEIELFEKEIEESGHWVHDFEKMGNGNSIQYYSDSTMLVFEGWLTAHRARDGEVERLRAPLSHAVHVADLFLNGKNSPGGHDFDQWLADARAALAATPADSNGSGVPDGIVDAMVEAFLTWELPKTICPDGGFEFTPLDHPHEWPVGTNMLSAPEAKAMVIHILSEAGFRLDAAPQPTNAAGEQGGES